MTSMFLAVFGLAVWMTGAAPAARQALQCEAPLSEGELRDLIEAGVPPARLRQLMTTCGIDLGQADGASTEARLRQIGASTAVLTALSPPPSAQPGAEWVSPFDRRMMRWVAPGRLRMGSPASEPNRDADETAHDVTIANGLWVDIDEVTNAAFQRFVLSRPEWQKGRVALDLADRNYLKDWNGTTFPAGRGNTPVTWVSWDAARAYAAWASKRLATEAEWEYVARAGTSAAYWWGEEFDGTRVAQPVEVAAPDAALLRRTNPWGLLDTVGGVWEWTASLYRPYPYTPTDGREDGRATGPRVIRGGSFANGARFLRAANRNFEQPAVTNDLVGFRCVR